MQNSAIWPDFRPEWILYEDASIIAIEKPARVSSEAADPKHPDDVVTRLKRFLAARDGVAESSIYLGVHQRLDRDTSGVLLYAKRREANASLAKQFETHSLDKRYLAVVSSWDQHLDVLRLEHLLTPPQDGRVEVARPGDKRAKHAITEVRFCERRGSRVLLECRPITGRTHQIRAQLAAIGSPIDGDPIYGGVDAPRMMLHASALRIAHPISNEPTLFETSEPFLMNMWRTRERFSPLTDTALLRALLRDALEARFGLASESDSKMGAFRIVNEAGDGLEGLAIDRYGAHLVVHFYSDVAIAERERITSVLAELGFDGAYAKFRPRQANRLIDTRRDEVAPRAPIFGVAAPEVVTVVEHGLRYEARLADGLSTGIFLDQRENRRRVREWSRGSRVLNLFSYHCAFTVAAAAGEARETMSVDASRDALHVGERNVAQVLGTSSPAHRFVCEDVFDTLAKLQKKNELFDLVIVDPPTYSTTKSSRWTSGSDWKDLAALVYSVTAKGGRILATSNDRRLPLGRLRRMLHEAARAAGVRVIQMKDFPTPRDFPTSVAGASHLKTVLVTLAD